MDKSNYIKALIPCLSQSSDCPYWDEKYHKCKMFAEENDYPWDECGEYIEAEAIKNFSDKALDNLANL